MIRMSNLSRHRPDDTLEWFYKEWHGVHVDLMRAAPGVMRLVRRYVQNPALHDRTLPAPVLPLAAAGWDAMSQLTFDNVESFIACFEDPDYIATVRSHRLSDPTAIVSMLAIPEAILGDETTSSGAKAVHFYKLKSNSRPRDLFAALDRKFVTAVSRHPGLLRYVRNLPGAAVAPSVFVGSRWEGIPFNTFAAFDEICFKDRAAIADYLADDEARDALHAVADTHLAPESFSYLCREIVQINNLESRQ